MLNKENTNKSIEDKETSSRWFLLVFGLVMFAIATLWYMCGGMDPNRKDGIESLGVLFSGFAFAAMFFALFMQREELSLQRKELRQTRVELEQTKEATILFAKATQRHSEIQEHILKVSKIDSLIASNSNDEEEILQEMEELETELEKNELSDDDKKATEDRLTELSTYLDEFHKFGAIFNMYKNHLDKEYQNKFL